MFVGVFELLVCLCVCVPLCVSASLLELAPVSAELWSLCFTFLLITSEFFLPIPCLVLALSLLRFAGLCNVCLGECAALHDWGPILG